MMSQMIKVTHVIDPQNFWGQIGSEELFSLHLKEEAKLQEFYTNKRSKTRENGRPTALELQEGQLVLAQSCEWKCWLLATINGEPDEYEVDVFFNDRGTTEFVSLTDIDPVKPDYLHKSRLMAKRCSLGGIRPIAKTWVSRAILRFQELVLNKMLDVHLLNVKDNMGDSTVDILIEDGKGNFKSVSEIMVDEGFGLPVKMEIKPDEDISDSGRVKIPAFSFHDHAKSASPETLETEEAEPDPGFDESEVELFRRMLGGAGEGTFWEKSDLTIGKEYQPNSGLNTLNKLRDQIRHVNSGIEPAAPDFSREEGSQEDVMVSTRKDNSLREYPEKSYRSYKGLKEYPNGSRLANKNVRDKSRDSSRGSSPGSPGRSPVQSRRPHGPQLDMKIAVAHNKSRVDDMLKTPRFSDTQPAFPTKSHVNTVPDRAKAKSEFVGEMRTDPVLVSDGCSTQSFEFITGKDRCIPTNGIVDKKVYKNSQPNVPARNGVQEELTNSQDSASSQEDLRVQPSPEPKQSGRKFGPRKGKKGIEFEKKKLENEYEWQRDKVVRKVKEIIKKTSVNNVLESMEDLQELASPAQSKLTMLPGPGDFPVVIDTLIDVYLETPQDIGMLICFLEGFTREPGFSTLISEQLWKHQKKNVKVSTSSLAVRRCHGYCRLLGQLYVQSRDWAEEISESIHFCMGNTLQKWSIFDIKSTGNHPSSQVELFTQCLLEVLQEAGKTLETCNPEVMKQIFSDIQQRQLKSDIPEELRMKLLNLMLERAQHWMSPVVPVAPNTGPEKPTRVETNDVGTEMYVSVQHVGVQTEATKELEQAPEETVPGVDETVSEACEAGPYSIVENMLNYLHLEELFPKFQDNAIRDSLLEVDFADLKELLKECGLKPGHILEIKTYLAKHRPWAVAVKGDPNGKTKTTPEIKFAAKPTSDIQSSKNCFGTVANAPCTSPSDSIVATGETRAPLSFQEINPDSVSMSKLQFGKVVDKEEVMCPGNLLPDPAEEKSSENAFIQEKYLFKRDSHDKTVLTQQKSTIMPAVGLGQRKPGVLPTETVDKSNSQNLYLPEGNSPEKTVTEHGSRVTPDLNWTQKSSDVVAHTGIIEIEKGPSKHYSSDVVKSVVQSWLVSDVADSAPSTDKSYRKRNPIRFKGTLGDKPSNKPVAEPSMPYSKPCPSPGSFAQVVRGERNNTRDISDKIDVDVLSRPGNTHGAFHTDVNVVTLHQEKPVGTCSADRILSTADIKEEMGNLDNRWGPKRRKCTLCGDTGHLIYDCPDRNKKYLLF